MIFSVKYVAENSNTQLPTLFKFSAVWGAHEGSSTSLGAYSFGLECGG